MLEVFTSSEIKGAGHRKHVATHNGCTQKECGTRSLQSISTHTRGRVSSSLQDGPCFMSPRHITATGILGVSAH